MGARHQRLARPGRRTLDGMIVANGASLIMNE
jgi:hypothetical protein